MTVTVTEFKKNFSRYETMAINEPVHVVNYQTGIEFVFRGSNPMKRRLKEMRKGKCTTTSEVLELCDE